jgi:4-hydroxy-3-polyprenylbenzoate decarboxylase
VIIDARKKPHHAPDLIKDSAVERKVDKMGAPGGILHGII